MALFINDLFWMNLGAVNGVIMSLYKQLQIQYGFFNNLASCFFL